MDLTKFGFSTSKKKKTEDHDDEKKEKKKQYETKRERNFQENWADEFTGVRHAVPLDEEGNIAVSKSTPKVMFCQTCFDYPDLADKNSSMYLDTSAFRKDTLISHWKSVSHKRCEDKKKLETKSKSDDTNSTASSSAS